jgi:uncharacterized protein YbjT (DUF2867 family)
MILLTGATGYVGGRLLRQLEEREEPVRCLTRRPERLRLRRAGDEVVAGDLLEPKGLEEILRGVDRVFYLVHFLDHPGDFGALEAEAAINFGRAAARAGVSRIVYLGGLAARDARSEHLASRQQVGRILRSSGVPTIELQASIIIGRGSRSFQMASTLVDRLPVMTTPRWVRTRAQPIAIEDTLAYLVAALDAPEGTSGVYQIGGADVVSYEGLMREIARQRGLERVIIPVPLLTPRLSSLWLALVTPVHFRLGRRLIDGVRTESVVTDRAAERVFGVHPVGLAEAVRRALAE